MGKWAERYIEEKSTPLTETTANSCQKPKKVGDDPLLSVIGSGFVPASEKKSNSGNEQQKKKKTFTESTAKTAKSQIDVLNKFIRLAQHYGADNGILLEQSEILAELDSEGIEELRTANTEVRQSWAESIATRLVQARGIVPKGWDKVAHCAHCGPVYSFHNLDTLSCGWCHMRLAGKWFPQPEAADGGDHA